MTVLTEGDAIWKSLDTAEKELDSSLSKIRLQINSIEIGDF